MTQPTIWEDCYEERWNGFIVPAAMQHPAKFSRGLVERIYDHMLRREWVRGGDLVGDCFGGVATGGLMAAYRGFGWVGVELEGRFCNLAVENFELHLRKWCCCGDENINVRLLWKSVREEARRSQPKATTEDGSVLRKGVPELIPHEGEIATEATLQKLRKRAPWNKGRPWTDGRQESKAPKICPVCRKLRVSLPVIRQGDSRKFHEVIGMCSAVVTSPPYADSVNSSKSGIDWDKAQCPERWGKKETRNGCQASDGHAMTYGNGLGQIGALKGGELAAVITSPPYADIAAGAGGLNTKPAKKAGQQSGRSASASSQNGDQRYGATVGQISRTRSGSLDAVVTSPPFLATEGGCKPRMGGVIDGAMMERHNATADVRYGENEGQIGNCKAGAVDAVVTSPPWESNCEGGVKASKLKHPPTSGKGNYASQEARRRQSERDEEKVYGESDGQIGITRGETYWEAMAQVYRSCFLAIKPGGYMAVVVKDFVKQKKRVCLCDDTVRLLEHVGFELVERARAMLTKTVSSPDLFDGSRSKTKERKSFFRRLHEAKPGAVRIDWEEVVFVRKPISAVETVRQSSNIAA